jgi:glycosyltransferase involved in cell wall biosynthesis
VFGKKIDAVKNRNFMKRLKIAYLTINDPLDKRSWSGITYYLGQGLQRNVGDVDFLGPLEIPWILEKFLRAISKFTRVVFKKEYHPKYSLLLGRYAAYSLKRKMKGKQYDCVIAPAACTEFAFFKTSLPQVYTSDATFELMSNFYTNQFGNICSFSRWEGNVLERKSLEKADFIIHCSNWAKQSAVDHYKISPEKIHITMLGANMDHIPSRDMLFEKEKNATLTLLFLAVDWVRKGGSIAFDTLIHLHSIGIEAKLIVCGCVPPPEFVHPFMEVIPFLNKNIKKDYDCFVDLLSTSHFLILPTRADCSSVVSCESNAYGMPTIITKTGGISDLVIDGINGFCMPFEAGGPEYAEMVLRVFSDKEKYHQLILSSRDRFEKELTWDRWCEKFIQLYQLHILKQLPVRGKNLQTQFSN